jgi:hypothetical protein
VRRDDGPHPYFRIGALRVLPNEVEVLQSAVDFGDAAGSHVELGYVFEQRKELAMPEDS